jgi:hypothetical protein
MMFFSRQTTVTILIGVLVSACGQKGKLVLPVRPPAISTPYPSDAPKAQPKLDADESAEATDKANGTEQSVDADQGNPTSSPTPH